MAGLQAKGTGGDTRRPHPKRLVLTAYEPFGARSFNSSALVGAMVADKLTDVGYETTFSTLPTQWGNFRHNLTRAIASFGSRKPDALISLGESAQATAVTVELHAIDEGRGIDTANVSFSGQLDTHGPHTRDAPADTLEALHRVNAAGYTMNSSTNAGKYLCNAALYTTLGFVEEGLVPHAAFIHVPARASQADPDAEVDAETVVAFITTLLDRAD